MSLIAAELERNGISTVVLQLLRVAAEKVGPPRALLVPFRHGYPLEAPNDPRSSIGLSKRHWSYSNEPISNLRCSRSTLNRCLGHERMRGILRSHLTLV